VSGGNDITLREGGSADIDEIMATMAEAFDPAFGEAWTAAQCLGILDLPGVWISLARRGGTAAGFALNRKVIDEAELLLIGVRPRFRREGIGRLLLDRTREVAALAGASRLHLEVRQGNGALELYRSAGFAEIGRRRGYYRGVSGQTFDAITLALALAPPEAL
jgi:ribosomal-protein-alanine N-acetyltransferase